MFTTSPVPPNQVLTRYIAPFGLTALLRPSKPGQSVDSFWVGSQGESGIVLFVSALDAEIYRLQAQTAGQKWVRNPLERIGFQYTLEKLGRAWTNLAFGFNANAHCELTLGTSGCFLLPYFPEYFGPLEEPIEPTTFQFPDSVFQTIAHQWALTGRPNYSETVSKVNALGTTDSGAIQLREMAEEALALAQLGPVGESRHELVDYAIFDPDAAVWCFGPNQSRQRPH
jgi:hypothetical protein